MEKRYAHLLVAGFNSERFGEFRELIISRIKDQAPGTLRVEESNAGLVEPVSRSLLIGPEDGDVVVHDFYEVYCRDLVVPFADLAPPAKFARGTVLLLRWFFSGVWRNLSTNFYLATTTVLVSLLLVAWYLGFGYAALSSLASFLAANLPPNSSWLDGVRSYLDFGANLPLFLVGSIVLRSLKFETFLELQNNVYETVSSGAIQTATNKRIRDTLNVIQSQKYNITNIVAFSSGAVPLLHYLVSSKGAPSGQVRIQLVGSPIGFLQPMSKSLDAEVAALQTLQGVALREYYYRGDFLCTRLRLLTGTRSIVQKEVRVSDSLFDRLTLSSHLKYFEDRETMNELFDLEP